MCRLTAAIGKGLKIPAFRWGVITLVNFVVNVGLTAMLHEGFGVDTRVAYAIALTTVFFMNFALLRYYVYAPNDAQPLGALFATYAASAIGFRLTEYVGFLLLHTIAGVPYLIAIFLVQGASFFVKYFYYGRLFSRNSGSERRSSK